MYICTKLSVMESYSPKTHIPDEKFEPLVEDLRKIELLFQKMTFHRNLSGIIG